MTGKPSAVGTHDGQTAPRHAWAWAVLVHAVATMSLAWPALSGRHLASVYSDQHIAGYAFREYARWHWETWGSIPQWNPWLYGGMPFVDAMHGDTFYPTALLRILIGTGPGMTWGFIIHLFLAGFFTWLFLRSCGLSFAAALVGGVAYQLGGNVAGLATPGHDGKLFVATMLPLALWAVTLAIRDRKRWAWAVLAFATGLAVLSPHPQLLQYMLLVTGAWALWLSMGWSGWTDFTRRSGLLRLAAALGAVGLGLLMGAIQFWPVAQYEPWSPRAGGREWEHAISYSMPPPEIVNFAVPEFTGMLERYSGLNFIHFHSEYLGIAALVLAGFAFTRWSNLSEKRQVVFWSITFVITLLWALGGYTPFYRLVYAIVPGTKYFRAPSTMLFVVSFATAMLAAWGAERVVRGGVRRSWLIGASAVAIFVGVLGLTGALQSLATGFAREELIERAIANADALRGGAIRAMVFALLAVASTWLVSARKVPRDLAAVLLAGVVAVDLWTIERKYWPFMGPASEVYAPDEAITWLQKQPQPFRVYASDLAGTGVFKDPNLGNPGSTPYDGLMTHRIAHVEGYHGNHIGKYDLLLSGNILTQLANPNFWRLTNLRYFYSTLADLPIPEVRRVLGPVRTAAGSEVYLHQLPVETSYAWVTAAIAKAEETAVAQLVLNPNFDLRSVALFDTSAAVEGQQLERAPDPLDIDVAVKSWRPGAATLELGTPAPRGSALVISENYYPGWTARVDGEPATVGRADVSLIGVPLPEGAREVEIEFVNRPYETGRLVTWFAVAAAAILLFWGLASDWRNRSRA
ncbi:MAG: hypothetical protein ACT4OZ_05765 [Gemmatimonadota bacterium]